MRNLYLIFQLFSSFLCFLALEADPTMRKGNFSQILSFVSENVFITVQHPKTREMKFKHHLIRREASSDP